MSRSTAAAFISGALGFFQSASSRGADRRLALAGLGPARVAVSRIAASVGLAFIAATAAFLALLLRVDVAHPLHAAVAILAFALNVEIAWLDLDLVGYILMGAGVLVFILGLVLLARRRRRGAPTDEAGL